jgi:hypothetical protein
MVFKKQFIGFLNALTDILYRLRANRSPERIMLSEFGDMRLKFRTAQVFTPHSVVPFV